MAFGTSRAYTETMKTLRSAKSRRIRFDGKSTMALGRYNLSFLPDKSKDSRNFHYTLSYGYEKKVIDVHVTWENPKRYYSIFRIKENQLVSTLDKVVENLGVRMKNLVMDMNVSPGLEKEGLFEHMFPMDKSLKRFLREFNGIFPEQQKKNEWNFITDEEEIWKMAMGSGKYCSMREKVKEFARVGFPMRLWNFKTATVSYKSLHLWILAYDKPSRRMKCIDLNKVTRETLLVKALKEAIGGDLLEKVEDAIRTAPDLSENLLKGDKLPTAVHLD